MANTVMFREVPIGGSFSDGNEKYRKITTPGEVEKDQLPLEVPLGGYAQRENGEFEYFFGHDLVLF